MKILASSLFCFVLIGSQCLAIKGGPDYGSRRVGTTGIYAGVFLPPLGVYSNSLGLFTVTIPKTGLATGTVAIFSTGNFYPGTIQGAADPDSAKLNGVVNASFQKQVATSITDTRITTLVRNYSANGSLDSQISANSNVLSSASARLNGTAALTFVTDDPDASTGSDSMGSAVPYTVVGFKQAQVN